MGPVAKRPALVTSSLISSSALSRVSSLACHCRSRVAARARAWAAASARAGSRQVAMSRLRRPVIRAISSVMSSRSRLRVVSSVTSRRVACWRSSHGCTLLTVSASRSMPSSIDTAGSSTSPSV